MFQHLIDSRFQLSFEEISQVDSVGSRKLLQLKLRTFSQLLGRVCCKNLLQKKSIQSNSYIKRTARYLEGYENTFLRIALVWCCFLEYRHHKMHELISWGMYMYPLRAKSQCHLGTQNQWQHFPSQCFLSSLLDSNSEMWNISLVMFEKYTNVIRNREIHSILIKYYLPPPCKRYETQYFYDFSTHQSSVQNEQTDLLLHHSSTMLSSSGRPIVCKRYIRKWNHTKTLWA